MNRSELMSRIRSVSAMERSAAGLARKVAGCPVRHQPKGVHGSPDYANKARKVAVFVDGCFWHACPSHGSMPKTNASFWRSKFRRNAARRKEVRKVLEGDGWKIRTLWEHDVRKRR